MPSLKPTPARQPKHPVQVPYLLAFAFPNGPSLTAQSPLVRSSHVAWTPEGRSKLVALRKSLEVRKGKDRIELPICDLRLRLQLEDKQVRRLDFKLSTSSTSDNWKTHPLLVSGAERASAERAANDAVLVWVRDVVRDLPGLDQSAAQALQDLAAQGKAVRASEQEARVFEWNSHRTTLSVATTWDTTQYADLADYVASLMAGQCVFGAERGPLLREVSGQLTSNRARLFTRPLRFPAGKGEICFSLGVTVSVETYPGRSLPVVQVQFGKRIWARKPTEHFFNGLSGYVLPEGEHRALRFEVRPDLGLDADYHAIAREYGLPRVLMGKKPITAKELARDGREAQGAYEKATVFITHRNGRGEKKPAQAGVTDQDRADGFAGIATVLTPFHLTPWEAVREVPTRSRQPKNADEAWRLFDPSYKRAEKTPKLGAQPKSPEKLEREAAKRETDAHEWRARMQQHVRDLYIGGPYRLVLGFQSGEQQAAKRAQQFLTQLLGPETIAIELLALPDQVHGNRYQLEGSSLKKAEERADLRTARWQEFVRGVRKLEQKLTGAATKAPATPVRFHGVLVLAKLDYQTPTLKNPRQMGKDDKVNKRAARLALMRGLALPAQYLLPPLPGPAPDQPDWAEFNRRLVNAWRDLAWKYLGYAPRLAARVLANLPGQSAGSPPVILGFGVLRSNRKGYLQNAVSFIPYALELNPATGTTRAALLLTKHAPDKKTSRPYTTSLLPLPEAVQLLAQNGASFLRHGGEAEYPLREQRQQYTQKFVYELIDQVAHANAGAEVVVFFDQRTLMTTWDWLSDQHLNPADVNFSKILPRPEPQAQVNWPNVSLLRLRSDHAPKALRSAPQSVLKTLDGTGERLAHWHSDAQLLRLHDSQHPGLTTYFSFGSDLDTTRTRGASCHGEIEKADGSFIKRHVKRWGTPNALEITVIGPADPAGEPRHDSDALATLAEALRYDHAHAPGWTALPVPLHFASLLRQYVPDYNMPDDRGEETDNEGDEEE